MSAGHLLDVPKVNFSWKNAQSQGRRSGTLSAVGETPRRVSGLNRRSHTTWVDSGFLIHNMESTNTIDDSSRQQFTSNTRWWSCIGWIVWMRRLVTLLASIPYQWKMYSASWSHPVRLLDRRDWQCASENCQNQTFIDRMVIYGRVALPMLPTSLVPRHRVNCGDVNVTVPKCGRLDLSSLRCGEINNHEWSSNLTVLVSTSRNGIWEPSKVNWNQCYMIGTTVYLVVAYGRLVFTVHRW